MLAVNDCSNFWKGTLMLFYVSIGLIGALALLALFGAVFVRLVIVREATAVAFKYLGSCQYIAMQYAGHHFDAGKPIKDSSVEEGDGPNSTGSCWCILRWGGWVFYIWPFVEPTNYTDQNNPDAFGEGVFVRLGDITPEPFVAMAETTEPPVGNDKSGSIGLDVKFVSTMRVVNPYRWLFSSPKDVNNQVVKRQDAVLRAWVRSGDQNHTQAARGNGQKLWDELVAPAQLNCQPIFTQIKDDWGLEVVPKSIIVEDVGYDPEYQTALKAQSQAALRAKASIEETTGRVMLAVANELALTTDELKEKLKTDPTLVKSPNYKTALAFAKDMVKRDRAGAAGELTDIRVGNSDGTSIKDQTIGLFLGSVAAAARQFKGGGGQGNRGGQGKRGGKGSGGGSGRDPVPEDPAELEEWARRHGKGGKKD